MSERQSIAWSNVANGPGLLLKEYEKVFLVGSPGRESDAMGCFHLLLLRKNITIIVNLFIDSNRSNLYLLYISTSPWIPGVRAEVWVSYVCVNGSKLLRPRDCTTAQAPVRYSWFFYFQYGGFSPYVTHRIVETVYSKCVIWDYASYKTVIGSQNVKRWEP